MQPELLFELLSEREKQGSTVLSAHLAIPHIVIDGQHLFDILIVRCKKGIVFSQAEPNVTAAFVIAGTLDERNFHLHALAAIAQIVQDPAFEKKWLSAKGKEALRDIVLLAKRKRR
jgi:mannitol/fructose-specific phosphotransferase system IIA component (Ntr-type)